MPFGPEPPQLLKQRFFFKGRKFSFEANRLRLPNKAEGEWECVRHPGGALAVPITPEGKFVLVRQYRFTARGRLLEFPAGTIEVDEDPLTTIEREIQEEIGYRASRWQKLGEFFVAPGYSDEIIHAYLAQQLEQLDNPPPLDADEDLVTVLMTADEVEQAIYAGELIDAKSICAFFMSRPLLNGQPPEL
ncbi:MAG: NUDIX hydrolase [Leptolyngbyaceae cyanobacterium bins.349]|nr:NUDIX hydrolase [Leptolyngbyaceae cyanobacterium bins.349]